MSVLPEILIQEAILNELKYLKENKWKVQQIFRTSPQKFVDEFFSVFVNTRLNINLGYPREDTGFPCILIILRGEQENRLLVGDFLSSGYEADSIATPGAEDLFFNSGVTESGAKYTRTLTGEPTRLFDKNTNKYIEQFGSGFTVQYMLQVMSDNQDFTIFLYAVLRHVMQRKLLFFEKNGLLEMSLSGSDFLPQAEQEPNFIYIRNLFVSFLNFTDYFIVPEDDEGDGIQKIAKAFVIDLIPGMDGVIGVPTDAFTSYLDEKDFSKLASLQSPHVREIFIDSYQFGGDNLYPPELDDTPPKGYVLNPLPSSFNKGIVIPRLLLSGINLKIGGSVQIYNSDYEYLEVLGAPSGPVFFSENGGTASSTTTTFVPQSGDYIPSKVMEGMYMRVYGPETHGAYDEERKIESVIVAQGGLGGSITVEGAFSAELDGANIVVYARGEEPSVEVIDEILNINFESLSTGQPNSTQLRYNAANIDNIPSTLLEGMFLQVVGPEDHPSYKESRRILSSTSGNSGTITVANEFSESLSGARVRVIELNNIIRFTAYVPTDASSGDYDVKFISSELLETTLSGGIAIG